MIAQRPSRSLIGIALALSVALEATGCSGGTATLTPVGRTNVGPASTATPGSVATSGSGVVKTGVVSGTVALPGGSNIVLTSLTVRTSIGSAPVSASGHYAVEGFPNGHALASVVLPSGHPVMLGFIGPNTTTLDATSTATVLGFYGCDAFVLTPDVVAQAPALVAAAPGFRSLAIAVGTAIASSPDPFAKPSTALASALQTFVDAAEAAGASSAAAVSTIRLGRDALTVSPVGSSNGSGVDLISEFPDGVHALNIFRRRAAAEVDRVSYVPSLGASPVPAATRLTATPVPIAPVNGLNGGLIAAIDDIFANALNGSANPSAYAPVTSASVSLPLVAGSAQTNYVVTLLGPGGHSGLYGSLDGADQTVQFNTALYYYIVDLGIPFITTVLLPLEAEKIDAFTETEGGADVISELLTDGGTLVPQLQIDLQPDASGHIDATQAVTDTIRNLVENPAYLTTVEKYLAKSVELVFGGDAFLGASAQADFQELNEIVEGFDFGLAAFDATVVGKDLLASNAADRYTVTVVPDKLSLTPSSQTVTQSTTATLTATDLTDTGSNAVPLQYSWTNTAQFGHITDGIAGHVDSFTSTKSTVTYTPTGSTMGTATITAQIATLQGPGSPSQPIGSPLSGTVTVDAIDVPSGKVILTPYCYDVNTNQQSSLPITAIVNLPSQYTITNYQWSIEYAENFEVTLDVPGSSVVSSNGYASTYSSASNSATLEFPSGSNFGDVMIGIQVFYEPVNKQLATPTAVSHIGGAPAPASDPSQNCFPNAPYARPVAGSGAYSATPALGGPQ